MKKPLPMAERPYCLYCKRPLNVEVNYVEKDPGPHRYVTRRPNKPGMFMWHVWSGYYGWRGSNAFCSKDHAASWALRTIRIEYKLPTTMEQV